VPKLKAVVPSFNTKFFNSLNPKKALLPIEVTELGIVISVKPVHPEKSPASIEVTEFPIVNDVKEGLSLNGE